MSAVAGPAGTYPVTLPDGTVAWRYVLTPAEAGLALGLSASSVRSLCANGLLGHSTRTTGGRYRIPAAAVAAYAASIGV